MTVQRTGRRQGWIAGFFALMLVALMVPGGTATAAGAVPSSYIMANMPVYAQQWNLTCEYAATSAATLYYGKQISESTFINDIGFDANPNKGFRGRLSGGWGGTGDYGIYPAPILGVLQNRGFGHSYIFRLDTVLLKYELSQNHPIVIWTVGTWGTAPRYEAEAEDGSYLLVPYEHAVTAYGYDETGVYIMDVAHGSKYRVGWDTFMRSWGNLDGMALAVIP